MGKGWVRDWGGDTRVFFAVKRTSGEPAARRGQAEFRRDFRTQLHAQPDLASPVLAELRWSDRLELAQGLGAGEWTAATSGGQSGHIRTAHVCEIAYVKRKLAGDDAFQAKLRLRSGKSADLLWGDMVQITGRDGNEAIVRARGLTGRIAANRLTPDPLLEVYFIDVGQGDGALIRYPDGKHMMIDGGMHRRLQQTGKSAADFVDWKFFVDYGDWRVALDDMVCSHCDADHYGGLEDLISADEEAREELDCLEVGIGRFVHAGLSRFSPEVHADKLGPVQNDFFTRLLGDRADAEALTRGAAQPKISGWWKDLIEAVLDNSPATTFLRAGIDRRAAGQGDLPELLAAPGYSVKVLAPVTVQKNGAPALKDLGEMSINTNGHSLCLRIDYDHARILMTGDLNSASMTWLSGAFGQHMAEWRCDVAKACHHGSDDVSVSFLQHFNAAATVISSGDNEGYAHPRPEIVAASAITGRRQAHPDDPDRLLTPLVYMTEVERSVALARVNRIEARNVSAAGDRITLMGKAVARFGDSEYLSEEDWAELDGLEGANERKAVAKARVAAAKPLLAAREAEEAALGTRARLFTQMPTGVVGVEYPRHGLKSLRIMHRNNYGLVNVRTDGTTIMCASKRDNGEKWTVHSFPAGF